MKNDFIDRQTIANQALATPLGQRCAFLDSACEGDTELRKEVESIITISQKKFNPTQKPARKSNPTRLRTKAINSRLRHALRANYILQERIGSGGMGDLYLAKNKILGGKWAIKVLAEDLAKDSRVVERFINEAKIEANLQHPNIVKVFTIGQTGSFHYFVMTYIEGEDLAERLKREAPLSEQESISIAFQVARALECAHNHNIYHRDLKPSNVRIDTYGTVFVLDFGIARIRDIVIGSRTGEGERLGTPLYMSPEQVQGLPVDARSDLYSLGVLLYEMLTGINPFNADTIHAVYSKHLNHIPIAPIDVNSSIPSALSQLVMRLLEKNNEHRIQSASELCILLRSMRDTTQVIPAIDARFHDHKIIPFDKRLATVMVKIPDQPASRDLAPEETMILSLTDGKKTVGEILALSNMEKNRFFSALNSLKNDSIICPGTTSVADEAPSNLLTNKWRSFKRRSIRIKAVYIAVFIGIVFLIIAMLTGFDQARNHTSVIRPTVQFDASPFAAVTVKDVNGMIIVDKQITPFLLNLTNGDYYAEFEHNGIERFHKFQVDASKTDLLVRQDFWNEQDIINIVDQALR